MTGKPGRLEGQIWLSEESTGDSFAIEQYEDAFNCMMERRARGKVIITM